VSKYVLKTFEQFVKERKVVFLSDLEKESEEGKIILLEKNGKLMVLEKVED